jgi:hypothetical protein
MNAIIGIQYKISKGCRKINRKEGLYVYPLRTWDELGADT